MGFLRSLFGPARPPARPYVDDGLALTKKLIGLLNLSGWATGTLTYTDREDRALERGLRSFKRMEDSGGVRFHPEIAGPLQREFCAEELRRVAGPDTGLDLILGWNVGDECPPDWKERVSTYLKAWAMHLDPDALIEMAQLLALVGYTAEAKHAAAIVVARFPGYAPRFFSGQVDPKIVEGIVARARGLMEEISEREKQAHDTESLSLNKSETSSESNPACRMTE